MTQRPPEPRSIQRTPRTEADGGRARPVATPMGERTTLPSRALAESLGGPLGDACEGRLTDLAWFRTDWQRGGAATAKGQWTLDDGSQTTVVVKVPVNARELIWMRRLQDPPVSRSADGSAPAANDGVVPRLLRSGEELGSLDLAWMVIEHLPHGPLGGRWHDDHIPRIADAIARFHARASTFPTDREPKRERWDTLVATAREAVKTSAVAQRQRWTAALRELSAKLDPIASAWEERQPKEWLHGDLHLANAMSRVGIDQGPVCLIDLAEVHVGHWVEDAIYLERQLWARPERLRTHKPVKCIAECRKAAGCDNGEEHSRLAAIRRLLLAATAPAFLKSEGAPAYLTACLDRLEEGTRE